MLQIATGNFCGMAARYSGNTGNTWQHVVRDNFHGSTVFEVVEKLTKIPFYSH
jgi:hypothetical protein